MINKDQAEQLVRILIAVALVVVAAGGIYAVMHLEGSC